MISPDSIEADYFLRHPPTQPKRQIVEYVGLEGFLVPKCFETLEAAKDELSTNQVFVRSEHAQDYDGASGLMDSVALDEIEDSARRFRMSHQEYVEKYVCNTQGLARLASADFLSEHDEIGSIEPGSVSYWEKINTKANIIVGSDPARHNTCHILYGSTSSRLYSLYRFDDNTFDVHMLQGTSPDEMLLGQVAHTFRDITTLRRFDQRHSYYAEFVQDQNDDIYFVQMHRGQDTQSPDFSLSLNDYGADWAVADFVVGSTAPEGIRVPLQRHAFILDIQVPPEQLRQYRHRFVYSALGRLVREYCALNSDTYVFGARKSDNLAEATGGHVNRTALFRPRLSLMLPQEERRAMTPEESVLVDIVSDGHRAVFRINKPS